MEKKTVKIQRQYGIDSPKAKIKKHLKEYIKVEQEVDATLTDAELFLLFLLRRYTTNYTPSQERLGEIMGVDRSNVNRYQKSLTKKGYIRQISRSKGRSKMIEVLKNPIKGYNKIPNALILDNSKSWKQRLFIVQLYNTVLDDVNEIHYNRSKLAKVLGMDRKTLRSNLTSLIEDGLINELENGYLRVDVYKILGVADDILLQQENRIAQLTDERDQAVLERDRANKELIRMRIMNNPKLNLSLSIEPDYHNENPTAYAYLESMQ